MNAKSRTVQYSKVLVYEIDESYETRKVFEVLVWKRTNNAVILINIC